MRLNFVATGLVVIVNCVGIAPSYAAAQSGGSSGSSGSSAPSAGAVTVSSGAGQLEGDLLSAREINHAADRICQAVLNADYTSATPAVPDNTALTVVPGTDRPDVSDWLVFQRRLELIKSEYIDTEKDFVQRHSALAKIKPVKPPLPSQRGEEANGAPVGKVLGSILGAFAPTSALMTAYQGLSTVAGGLSSTYNFGGGQVTFSDYGLALAVAGHLPTQYDAVLPAHLDVDEAAQAIQDTITSVETEQATVQKKDYAAQAAADLKRITTLMKSASTAQKAELGKFSAAITIDVANLAQADSDLRALKVALMQPVAGAAPAAATPPTDSTQQSGKGTTVKADTAATPSGPTLLAVLLREKVLYDRLKITNARVLYIKIELAWGGYYTKQNLLTFFGANPMHVAGGVVVNYAYYVGSRRKASGFLPLGSGYLTIDKVKNEEGGRNCAIPTAPGSGATR